MENIVKCRFCHIPTKIIRATATAIWTQCPECDTIHVSHYVLIEELPCEKKSRSCAGCQAGLVQETRQVRVIRQS